MSGSALLMAGVPIGADAGDVTRLGGMAFGSYWRISLAGSVSDAQVRRPVEQVIAEVDATMSPWRPHSEIALVNGAGTPDWLPMSESLRTVIAAALTVAEETGGAFDPTVGPIVGRYGFGPIIGSRGGSFRQLQLSDTALRKELPGITVDLCGIAKGYALDRICAALRTAGLDDWLVELGGEVAASGRHPSGRVWQVAVERAGPGTRASHVLALGNAIVATSGDAANSYTVAGRRYSHIIDPRSGAPAKGSIASVSVRAESAMRADALATALAAMGREAAIAFAQNCGIDALFMVRHDTSLETVVTGRLEDIVLA